MYVMKLQLIRDSGMGLRVRSVARGQRHIVQTSVAAVVDLLRRSNRQRPCGMDGMTHRPAICT